MMYAYKSETNAFYLRTDIVLTQHETVIIPTVDENGASVMEYRQKLDADGNPVVEDVILDDGSVVQMPAMEQVQATHPEQRPVYPPLPAGYAEVTEEEHTSLFTAQSQGMVIQPDPAGTGRPVALPPIPPTADEELRDRALVLRNERDSRIYATQWLMERHTDELANAGATTLSVDQYAALLVYRQALRDMPQAEGFPWDGGGEATPWPVQPGVASHTIETE